MKIKDLIKELIEHNKTFFEELRVRRQMQNIATLGDVRSKVLSESAPIFCLSTGRAGTKYLTESLLSLKELDVHHEPSPEFLYHNRWAYENPEIKGLKSAFDIGRYELMRKAFVLNKKYIETNNRVTFFAPAIAELFPNSKFIYLNRDCTSFVKSGLQREWYKGAHFDEGRIVYENTEVWNKWTQAEKITWLWCETNRFIEEFIKTLSNDRVLSIQSKDLFMSIESKAIVANFIGVDKPSWPKKKVNRSIRSYTLSEQEELEIEGIKSQFYSDGLFSK